MAYSLIGPQVDVRQYLIRLRNQAIPCKERLIHYALVREAKSLGRGVTKGGILRHGKLCLGEISTRYISWSITTIEHIIIIAVITLLKEQKNSIGVAIAKR